MKAYCDYCKWYGSIFNSYAKMAECLHPDIIQWENKSDKPKIVYQPDLNKNNDCKYFKLKWWRKIIGYKTLNSPSSKPFEEKMHDGMEKFIHDTLSRNGGMVANDSYVEKTLVELQDIIIKQRPSLKNRGMVNRNICICLTLSQMICKINEIEPKYMMLFLGLENIATFSTIPTYKDKENKQMFMESADIFKCMINGDVPTAEI